jgi:myo-inositol-1(or 4)-monophosphatase
VAGVAVADLVELAIALAEEAGTLLSRFAAERLEGADLAVAAKSSATDPVSEADRAAERLIATRLAEARPDDGLLAEEAQGNRAGRGRLRWLVDPLDGTVNFLYGRSAWAVSIAAEDATGTLLGVVHQPALGETFHAVRGDGAYLGRSRLAVSSVAGLDRALVATGFGYEAVLRAEQGRDVADLLPRVRDVRRDGSAALDLAWCAAGRVDAYLEFGLAPWDWAAGALLVREAGGVVSDHPRTMAGRRRTGLVAGGAAAHDALVGWLAGRA